MRSRAAIGLNLRLDEIDHRLRIVKFEPLQPASVACAERRSPALSPFAIDRLPPFQHFSQGRRRMTLEISESNGAANPPTQKKVLIVEDNDLNMKLFNDLLVAHGYGTLQTKDGVEAIALIRQHHPDLILMDIQLPEISGLEVMQWIKKDDDLRMIPIIAVTSFAMKGDEEKIREGGCEAYISKPISVASFLRTVERFLS